MRILTTFLLLISTGCSTYSHRVVNTSDEMLYAVTIESGEKKIGYGYLPANTMKSYHGSMVIKQRPAPVVSWKNSLDGETFTDEVFLTQNPRAAYCVVFEIDGTHARARFERR